MAEPARARLAEAEVLEQLAELARGLALGIPLEPDLDLQRDLALDSLALLSLVVAVEDHFEVALSEQDTADVHTARELAALILRKKEP